MTMSGDVLSDEVEGRRRGVGTADDDHAAADGEQPGQTLPDPIVGVDDQHTDGLVGP